MASSNGMKKFLLLLQQYPEVFCRGARLDLKCSEDVTVKQKNECNSSSFTRFAFQSCGCHLVVVMLPCRRQQNIGGVLRQRIGGDRQDDPRSRGSAQFLTTSSFITNN